MTKYKESKRKRSDSESDCCSSLNLIKYMLHTFNFVFLVTGITVLGVAIWTIVWKHEFVSLLTSKTYLVGTYAFAIAGILAIIGHLLACCGVFYENRALILCYIFTLVLVFLLEITVGGLAYIYETKIEDVLQLTLKDTFIKYYGYDTTKTNAIDLMHQKYKCCGAVVFQDWNESDWFLSNGTDQNLPGHLRNGRVVPDSCCITLEDLCGRRDHPSNIFYTGCIHKMTEELRQHLGIIGAVGLGICLVQIIGIILSCCLYIKLKDPDD